MVTHADGTLVTALSPAKPGEEVVIYAFGLGYTKPFVQTGAASPAAATGGGNRKFRGPVQLLPNAAPSVPYVGPGTSPWSVVDPVFAGLTPGQVGLYQIQCAEFRTRRLRCFLAAAFNGSTGDVFNGSTGDVITLFNVVESNLTINIRGIVRSTARPFALSRCSRTPGPEKFQVSGAIAHWPTGLSGDLFQFPLSPFFIRIIPAA